MSSYIAGTDLKCCFGKHTVCVICLIRSTLELTCTFETDRVLRFEDSAHCDSATTLGNEKLRSIGYALHAYGFLYTTRLPEINCSSGAVQNERSLSLSSRTLTSSAVSS